LSIRTSSLIHKLITIKKHWFTYLASFSQIKHVNKSINSKWPRFAWKWMWVYGTLYLEFIAPCRKSDMIEYCRSASPTLPDWIWLPRPELNASRKPKRCLVTLPVACNMSRVLIWFDVTVVRILRIFYSSLISVNQVVNYCGLVCVRVSFVEISRRTTHCR